MDKYGVDQDTGLNEENKKTSSDKTGVCPWCGTPVLKHGSVVLCPKHGSEPFETPNE